MLSTYPPTSCGIATFAAALSGGLEAIGHAVDIVSTDRNDAPEVTATMDGGTLAGIRSAVRALGEGDVAIVQHEYGIYGSDDGAAVLDVVRGLDVPVVVVAHTVLSAPSTGQHSILAKLGERADLVVVMTDVGRERLSSVYGIDRDKTVVIAHGAAVPVAAPMSARDHTPRLLTWGLLGPGKGIEWAIDAMSHVHDLVPRFEYLIAGATHPKVLERSGEAYRRSLLERAAASPMADRIVFDARYRSVPSLNRLVARADLVVLPYDSDDQVTSGVLVDAVAAGRPVVSTAFPHAVELLSSGAGIVVAQRDPDALGRAIRRVLTMPTLRSAMAAEAARLAPSLSWAAVAQKYADAADALATRDERPGRTMASAS